MSSTAPRTQPSRGNIPGPGVCPWQSLTACHLNGEGINTPVWIWPGIQGCWSPWNTSCSIRGSTYQCRSSSKWGGWMIGPPWSEIGIVTWTRCSNILIDSSRREPPSFGAHPRSIGGRRTCSGSGARSFVRYATGGQEPDPGLGNHPQKCLNKLVESHWGIRGGGYGLDPPRRVVLAGVPVFSLILRSNPILVAMWTCVCAGRCWPCLLRSMCPYIISGGGFSIPWVEWVVWPRYPLPYTMKEKIGPDLGHPTEAGQWN